MKYVLASGALALLSTSVSAFPALSEEVFKRAAAPPQGLGAGPLVPPPFNAKAQRVSTTGQHAFVAPTASDERGECPGLNALANHGYLPHNGKASIAQFITATYQGFGMSQDLSGFLAVFGSVVDGNGLGWSIGGVPHTGILGSHGNYETDSSPLKSDLNQYGSNGKLIMSQFRNLYDRQPDAATANYNLEVMRDFRGSRLEESKAKNPYFVYGPFTGIAVSQAAFTFIYRFMGNKSAEAPEGILNKATLKSFMSISGPEDNLVWTPGHERFPDNWYKRNDLDQYSIPYFLTDVIYFAEKYPAILIPGCNQGKVNTYNPISVESLSNGAYTAESLLANPLCFASQIVAGGSTSLLGLPVGGLGSQLSNALNSIGGGSCPKVSNPDLSQLKNCPGFSFYGGPTGKVAPGAIMS